MKRSVFYCCAAVFAASSAFAQTPTIGAIAHAATYSPAGIPNSAIPQGGFFAIFGTNTGPAAGASANGPFQTTLAGVSVSVTASGTTVAPLLYFVYGTPTGGQINGVLPSNTPIGAATVTVTYNNVTSAPFAFNVAASNFGFFTSNFGGTGPAVAQSYPSYSLNTLTGTAKPGDTLILYGTGLGPAVNNQDETPAGGAGGYGTDLRSVDNLDFHLYLGGIDATSGVGYAGRSADVALDQINFVIPSNAPTGCFVPIIVRIGSVVSNSASISINAAGQTCSDPYGLTPAQISQASTGDLHVGSVLLTRLSLNIGLPVPITEDDVDARFYNFTGGSILNNADFLALSSFGSCLIANCSNTYTCVPSAQGLNVPKLDAGSSLSVSGKNVPTTSVPLAASGIYDAKLGSNPLQIGSYPKADYLNPANGPFTVTGTGVGDVKAFTASISVPAPLGLSSPQFSTTSQNVSRANPLTVNWTGAGSTGWVLISVGSATNIGTTAAPNYNSATVTCLQPASLGTYTIPSWLLEALPASSSVTLVPGITAPGAAVLVGAYNPVGTFTAPGIDVGLANSIVSSGQNVNLQ